MVPTSCQLSQAHGELGERGRRVPQNGLEKQRQALELQNNPISSGELGAISCGCMCVWGVLLGPKHQLTQAPNPLLDFRIHTQRGNRGHGPI